MSGWSGNAIKLAKVAESDSAPPEKTFSTKKEKIGGGNLKNAKEFFWRDERAFHHAGGGAELDLAVSLKIGSNFVVERHSDNYWKPNCRAKGGFFFGFAEQKPDVFRGRVQIWGSRRLRLFGF